jgi:hypothetical protein
MIRTRGVRRTTESPRLLSHGALLCVAIFCVCMLLMWPVAEIGFNDDWSYILTTQSFLHTHHFVYNGWAAPILGWQIVWGSVFGWLFGPSFVSIRLSMIPVALATAVLYHAILRNFSLNRAHALFGTLTFVLSPLFLSLSATFMTDIPGVFSVLLCVYLCQRALAAENDKHAALWLIIAGLTNIVSGTARQTGWVGVLVVVPSCGWLLRRRRYAIPATVVTWVAGVISIKLLIAWFLRHPYTIPETFAGGAVNLGALAAEVARGVMTVLLFSLPVLTVGLSSLWPLRRRTALTLVSVLVPLVILLAVFHHSREAHVLASPWLGNGFSDYGLMRNGMFRSDRQIPAAGKLLLFFSVVICTLTSFETFSMYRHRSVERPASSPQRIPWRNISILLLPSLAAYCLLLLQRAAVGAIFDRYLFAIVAVLLVFALAWHQDNVSARIPVVSIAVLAIITLLSVADLHDLFSMSRAEVRVANELQNAGIPRTEIDGGFAFDFETQVYASGYINEPHIINPPGAYHPQPAALAFKRGSDDCGDSSIQRFLPNVHPRYVIFTYPTACFTPGSFAPQSYTTWIQPGRHDVSAGILLPPPE